ncbi:MAG: hypothetical protein IPL49_01755 [Saprospirales bacterium]|nr:hypothetical protein [Saprospirales bacterium]MBK8489643.1 hypothetical protein [Saprospirales bacterium]
MKRSLLIAALMGAFLTLAQAQSDETLFNKSGLGLTGAWGGWTTGIAGFSDHPALTKGGFGGLEFGKNLFVGWAGYKTLNRVPFASEHVSQFGFDYGGLMLGYAPGAKNAIHPQFGILLGGGEARVEDVGTDAVWVIQPSLGVEFNVFRWFRIGVEGGYNYVSNSDIPDYADQDLSNFYGQLRLKFGWSWGR